MIDDTFKRLVFIECMKCPHGFVNIEMLQEFATGTGIFSKHHIATVQHTYGPESHIFEIPNGCGHYIKHGYGLSPLIVFEKNVPQK